MTRSPRPLEPVELKNWRSKHRLSQAEAAKFLNVPLRTYQGWESIARRDRRKNVRLANFIREAIKRKPRKEKAVDKPKSSTDKTLFD